MPARRGKAKVTKMVDEQVQEPGVPRERFVYCCDLYPDLGVVIPAWREEEGLAPHSMLQFRGGSVNLIDTFASIQLKLGKKDHLLTPERMKEAIAVLDSTAWLYRSTGPYKCGQCGKVYETKAMMQQHEYNTHGEMMNAVRARH